MIDQRDSLAREVDEELRREQLLKLWERYGTYIVAAAILLIAAIGGYKFWDHRRQLAAEAAGARFSLAGREIQHNNKAEAEKTLEDIARSSPAGYAALARLKLAAAAREAGRTAEALATYETLAKEGGTDPLLADYAQLQAALLALDNASWTEMQNRLNGLMTDNNPWRYSARELLALAALKVGKAEEARAEYQHLMGDRGTPPGIAERARMMMAMLTEAELAKAAPASGPSSGPSSAETPATPNSDAAAEPARPAGRKGKTAK